jgi:hypothetical protein
MAMDRTANAVVQTPSIHLEAWDTVKRSAPSTGNRVRTASLDLNQYSPDRYLLTHCTIIASVDVDTVPQSKTGSKVVNADGETINRPWQDYLITPASNDHINANGDAWERKLLLATYQTFCGAENYVEHIQIPELSKGKIIDAVARDLGDTIYVDILVATERVHTELIASIESEELNTLSMGCSIAFSICTRCGNKAKDDSELCKHIAEQKGTKFIDADGNVRIVAELCGHHTDPESVCFIEASWVGNPAFKGAVMRNILTPFGAASQADEARLAKSLAPVSISASVLPHWTDMFTTAISTSDVRTAAQVDHKLRVAFGFEEEEEGEEEAPAEEVNPVDEAVGEFKTKVRDRAVRELRDEVRNDPPKKDLPEAESRSTNDNIMHSYKLFASRYSKEITDARTLRRLFALIYTMDEPQRLASVRAQMSNRDITGALYLRDRDTPGRSVQATALYNGMAEVGGVLRYSSRLEFLQTLAAVLGRVPSKVEARYALKNSTLLH